MTPFFLQSPHYFLELFWANFIRKIVSDKFERLEIRMKKEILKFKFGSSRTWVGWKSLISIFREEMKGLFLMKKKFEIFGLLKSKWCFLLILASLIDSEIWNYSWIHEHIFSFLLFWIMQPISSIVSLFSF